MKNLINLNSVLEAEKENTKKTLEQYEKEFEYFERSFNLLSETFDYLCELVRKKEITKIGQKICLIKLMPRVFQTLQSIRVLFLRAYYYDAKVLERSIGESMGLCAYLVNNEKEAKKWLCGKRPSVSKTKLIRYPFKLFKPKDATYPPSLKNLYCELSKYVHSDVEALSLITYNDKSPKAYLETVPKFKKEKYSPIGAYPMFTLILLLEVFRDELADKRENILMRAENIVESKKFFKTLFSPSRALKGITIRSFLSKFQ